ncbi:MAG TPA: UDP-N-acetylglucosamine 2-epimerase (non-hydrolyzing) [Casimicrobiaceae bacterium]|nr:UDP-N-acetylglucosamine 2-epimerase (non-hydrolyzing) [Casimicrobiaceae bacterium]
MSRPRHRIACILGTRPEVVKMAPVIDALRRSDRLEPVVINTGQHRELLSETMRLFDLRPQVSLDLMQEGQRLAGFFGRCVEAVDRALHDMHPAAIVAQGDTSTVLAASLCAFYQQRPFFHVEAGLRTRDFRNPFPEEMNRTIAGRFAALHFAPTGAARLNLMDENVPDSSIVVTGNTVIDALMIVRALRKPYDVKLREESRLVLVTAHRRENFGAPLRSMLRALKTIARRWPDVEIVYPAHPNPEVRRAIDEEIGDEDRIRIVEPLGYGAFVTLLDRAHLVLTDSGGIQEEAPALGKPVLVMRDETERPEAITAGVARLVGMGEQRIVDETARLLDDAAAYADMAKGASPYGDGHAAGRIVKAIDHYLAAPAHARLPH